jgi:hypothetical protein
MKSALDSGADRSREAISRRRKNQPRAGAQRSPRRAFAAVSCLAVLALLDACSRCLGRAPSRAQAAAFLRGFAARGLEASIRGAVPEFGVFAGLPCAWVEQRFEALIEAGLVEASSRGSSAIEVLTASARGQDALRGRWWRVLDEMPDPGAPEAALDDDGDEACAEARALQRLRAQHARREGRPAFSIFSNATLKALLRLRPRHLGDLAGVPGLGPERLRRYGAAILRALKGGKDPDEPPAVSEPRRGPTAAGGAPSAWRRREKPPRRAGPSR